MIGLKKQQMKKGDKKIPNIVFFILSLLFLLNPVSAVAGLLRFESENYGSVKNGDDLQMKLPLYEYLSASYATDDQSLQINGNLGFFEDVAEGDTQFYLYLMDASYAPMPDLFKIFGGRSLNIFRSIDSITTDTIGGEFYLLEKQINIGGFWGAERELELGNFSSQKAYIGGAYSSYQTSSMFPYIFYLKYLNRNYSNPANPIENVMQGGVHKTFPGFWNPEVFFDTEFDIFDPSHLKRLEVGTDLYTTLRSVWRLRGLTYDFLPTQGIQQPIFSIFSQGRLYEASTQFEYKFTENLITGVGFSWDNYLWQDPTRTNGYLVEFDTKYYGDLLDWMNTFFYFESYGGDVFGDRLHIGFPLTDEIKLKTKLEYDWYDKVTSSERFSFHAEEGIEFWLLEKLRLYLGGEFNSNNTLEYDLRFDARLTYVF